jgi:hypothetical protein
MREKIKKAFLKIHESRITNHKNFMKNTKQTTHNETDKSQWWQRFAQLLGLRRAAKLKAPGGLGLRFQHTELVVRNFPIAFGKTLQAGHK